MTIFDFAAVWGKGALLSTKPSVCVQPQSTVFGEPMHCWITMLRDVPFYWNGKLDNTMRESLLKLENFLFFRVGIFLDFVWLTTRAEGPHGAHVWRSTRK